MINDYKEVFMFKKHDYRYYLIILVLGFTAVYFDQRLLVIALMLVAMLAWFFRDLKVEQELEEVETTLDNEKIVAEGRADDADVKLNQLINSIPSPLTYVNQRGDFEVSNVSFDQMLHVEPDNVYDVKINSSLRQIMLDAFLNEKQFIRQFNYEGLDFQVHSIPIVNDNRYHGCMIIFQDVTQITDGEKIQKRFIADASHELKTPIKAIKSMIKDLNQEGFDDHELELEHLKGIEKQTSRLEHIVKDLLLQSRLKADKVYLETSVFNLRQFFEGLIHERRQELHHSNIKVRLNCPSNITILADQFRLSQVFLNLFNNAINYTENGKIDIECESWDGKVKITFSDDGKGIKEEILPLIFDRFYSGDENHSGNLEGSGLGLAISKEIIKAHGGSLKVESEYGKGTQFTIELSQI